MTHRNGAARGADVLGRWRVLAEQRLVHLTELFESGRWRRYYSEQSFLENIREAKSAVETWRGLSTPSAPSRQPAAAEPPIPVRAPAPVIALEPIEKPVAAESGSVAEGEAPAVDLALERALEAPDLALEFGAIEQRYPLLRNKL